VGGAFWGVEASLSVRGSISSLESERRNRDEKSRLNRTVRGEQLAKLSTRADYLASQF
jgi:hypothetical protein